MNIATLVYQQSLSSRGTMRRFWSLLRRVLIWLVDPVCTMPIHGRDLRLPLSHALPGYLQSRRFYDRLPCRLGKFIKQRQGTLNCIDVGANIGDTVAAFYQGSDDLFLAIEPNPGFYQLLQENWGWNKNVTLVDELCSSGSSEGPFVIQEKNGTASIQHGSSGVNLRRRPLDEIINDHPAAVNANVLKIDTDGHDFEVLAGAQKLVSRNLPAVLFECDVFGNATYVEDCRKILDSFKQIGYHSFLVYDNFGHPMGRYALSDLTPFMNMLFYQLTSHFYYFDILVMKEEEIKPFYKSETDYFVSRMSNPVLRRTAAAAIELPQ